MTSSPPRLVPASTAALALPTSSRRAAASALVAVGASLEVDVDVLAAADPAAAARVVRYEALCRLALTSGLPADRLVEVEVPLRSAVQSTSKGSAHDLVDELSALEAVGSPLLSVLDAVPPAPGRHGGLVVRRSGDRTVGRTRTVGAVWPLVLGGPPSPWEVARVLEVEVSHARWRDRRLRRLVRLSASAVERRPDPALLDV